MNVQATGIDDENLGNPDAENVQKAIDSGEDVFLSGNFDFRQSHVEIKTTKDIVISGLETNGQRAYIRHGSPSFTINASAKVTIKELDFGQAEQLAIVVRAVKDLEIFHCNISQVDPRLVTQGGETFATAIGIVIAPSVDTDGKPTTIISGTLLIHDNEIAMGAGSGYRTLGVLVNQVGANVAVVTNKISGVTARGLDLRAFTGEATIFNNTITMNADGVSKPGFLVTGINCSGPGKYSVEANTINCAFETAAGIRLFGNNPAGTITGAEVKSNHIVLSRRAGAVAERLNAGIEIRGNCAKTNVWANTISGIATAALSVVKDRFGVHATKDMKKEADPQVTFKDMNPSDTTFFGNLQKNFTWLVADIFVGEDVSSTKITAPFDFQKGPPWQGLAGSVRDLGQGTEITGDYVPAR
jgi:hypothetical protein